MIFDDFKKCMPFWLYPIQLRLIPVNDNCVAYCESIAEKYKDRVRIDIDDRVESVSKKVKDSFDNLIPFNIVIGEKEISLDYLEELEDILEKIIKSSKGKPFVSFSWPKLMSKQII